MKQIVHIFAKDVRHLWTEIAISLALVMIEVFTGHFAWTVRGPQRAPAPDDFLRLAVSTLMPLIVISWILLIARVIQSDALVGDRQFWITRPYEWKRLMAAKLLFLVTFIFVPFFAMQFSLLAQAGFSPLHWLPMLMLNLAFLTVILFTFAALSTVTPNFGRIVVFLLGLLVCGLAILLVSALVGFTAATAPSATPVASYLSEATGVVLASAAIVLEYRTRKTKLSWLLVVAIPVCLLTIGLIAPDQRLTDRTYPSVDHASDAPVQLSFDAGDHETPGYMRGEVNQPPQPLGKWIAVNVPIHLSGIASGSAIIFNAMKVSMEAASGRHWDSDWQEQQGSAHRAGSDFWMAQFTLPTKIFNEFSGAPVTVRLAVTMTEVKAGNTQEEQLPQPMQEFTVSGFGICASQKGDFKDAVSVSCRFPWRAPMTYVSARWFDGPCASVNKSADPGIEGDGWVGSINRMEGWLFFPVVTPNISLSNSMQFQRNRQNWRHLCPGTPMTFTHYEPVRRAQESLTIGSFDLGQAGAGD